MRSPRGVAVSIAAVLLIALSGCGDEDPEDGGRPPVAGPGEGGELAYALATAPAEVDPLLASDRSSLLVTRQIHEPLVGTVTGPFGDLRTFQGLAQAYRPSGDRTIWRFELRPRVRFQDGTPFNAAAVLANAERWQALARGRRLLGDVIAIDAPTTDLVRFVLASPDPDFPSRLTAPELGIVSPNAISADHPSRRVTRDERTGTGPFELRTLTESDALVVRNVDWWSALRRHGLRRRRWRPRHGAQDRAFDPACHRSDHEPHAGRRHGEGCTRARRGAAQPHRQTSSSPCHRRTGGRTAPRPHRRQNLDS